MGQALEQPRGPSRAERMRARASKASADYLELSQRRPVLGLPMVFLSLYLARQGMLLASAVAFRMFLWLLPLALIAAGLFAGLSSAYPEAPVLAADAVGVTGTARQAVAKALAEGYESWWIAVVVGLAAFLWPSRTLLRNLVLVSAHLWQVPRARQTQTHVLLSTVIFAGVRLPLLMVGAVVVARLDALFPGAWILAVGLEAGLCAAAWLVVCRRLPDRREGWQDLLPGSAFFGIAVALIHLVSRVYLPARIEHSSALYGSLGVAGAILVWLLVFGQLVVASILVNVVSLDYREQGRSLGLVRGGPGHDQ